MKRKGITPVIGTALLILIAVSAVASASVFIQDTTDNVASQVDQRVDRQEYKDNSGIDIEYAYPNADDNITLVVRNTGQYTLKVEEDNNKIWNLYANSSPVGYSYPGGSTDKKIVDPDTTVELQTFIDFPNGEYVKIDLEGPYDTSSSIICDETVVDSSC